MPKAGQIPAAMAALLVYSRPVLVFGGMLCALAVMWARDPVVYIIGVSLLFVSMTFDLVDGWFDARYRPNSQLAHLADRLMDKLVYSIIFPVIAVGMMWRLVVQPSDPTRGQLIHAIFVLLLCAVVLVRDNFAAFMRGFAIRQGAEPEHSEYNRMRTAVAAPVSAILYAYAFYVPEGPPSQIYFWISWLGNIPQRPLLVVEILFLVITLGSIAGYCRKYGTACLDELCLGEDLLRRRILSVFPNALTVMNAMMGFVAVFFAYQERFKEAYLMMIGAATFDKLDGAVARRLGLTEPAVDDDSPPPRFSMGGLMDDIADAISFCIVPAWIFTLAMNAASHVRIEWAPVGWIAIGYGFLGITRLIYFTLDTKPIPGFFKGLPTPAAAMLVLSPIVILGQALQDGSPWADLWANATIVIMVLSMIMMNAYPIRYLHFGRFMGRHPWFTRINTVVMVVAMFTPWLGFLFLGYMTIYLFSPLITWRVDPSIAAQERR